MNETCHVCGKEGVVTEHKVCAEQTGRTYAPPAIELSIKDPYPLLYSKATKLKDEVDRLTRWAADAQHVLDTISTQLEQSRRGVITQRKRAEAAIALLKSLPCLPSTMSEEDRAKFEDSFLELTDGAK